MKLLPFALCSVVFAGCATSQMKSTPFYTGEAAVYTGRIEDRVNMWPIGYYREPALSVIWPIFSMTDDHLAVRPLYSQYRHMGGRGPYDEFNFLWPLCQFDARDGHSRFFPFFWGDDYFDVFPTLWWKRDRHFCVLPIWWSYGDHHMLFPLYYRDAYAFVTLLFGWSQDASWVFPFYFGNRDTFATLPFVSGKSYDKRYWGAPLLLSWGAKSGTESSDVFLLGLGGKTEGPGSAHSLWMLPFFHYDERSLMTPLFGYDRTKDGTWLFPFYYCDDDMFFSMPYWRRWAADDGKSGRRIVSHGSFPFWYASDERFISPLWVSCHDNRTDEDTWFVPATLSWGRRSANGYRHFYLGGLGGCASATDGAYADWIAPLYYRNEHSFFTPICGKSGDCNWFLPLWWQDQDSFMTILYGQGRLHGGNPGKRIVLPPLLSGYEWRQDGSWAIRGICNLWACQGGVDGRFDRCWIFPLWGVDRDGFFSLPFQYDKGNSASIAFFAGISLGKRYSGGWLWPLFGWKGDRNMPRCESIVNSDHLDSKVNVFREKSVANGRTNYVYSVKGIESAHDSAWHLSGLGTSDHRIEWSAMSDGGRVCANERFDTGNNLVFKREGWRTVMFDSKTRKKTDDSEGGECSALCNLLWHSEYKMSNGNLKCSKKSLLWRLWHSESRDGDVSIDVFPFFTYDGKRSGYSKTSLLWRLFRNEYDPEKGREVDFLFIPVWR